MDNLLHSTALCPNHCSGHGRCLRVRDIHQEPNAFPFGHNDGSYTGDEDETTWAENKIYACVCDSSWKVGYKPGEVQEPEFFGPDCSLSELFICQHLVHLYIITFRTLL